MIPVTFRSILLSLRRQLIGVMVVLFLVLCAIGGAVYWITERIDNAPPQKIERIERAAFLTEYGINDRVQEMIRSGREEDLYRFYDTFTGNRGVTYALISTSLVYKIPINYMFGLAWTESRFFPLAENKEKNKDGSADYGLMQLNSNTFKQHNKETLLDLTHNVRLGAEFVLKQYQKYGNWYETFMGYNGGNTELVKNPTINHMVSVLEYARKLDVEFSRKF